MWTNIAQGIYQCNVGPWLTNNFSKQNKLCNVVSTKLGQHCMGISYTQCCPNTSETTLHTKITCAILVLSAQQCVCRKITYIILSWSAWGNIAQNSYLCNVDTVDHGPQSSQCCPNTAETMLHKKITVAVLAQTT